MLIVTVCPASAIAHGAIERINSGADRLSYIAHGYLPPLSPWQFSLGVFWINAALERTLCAGAPAINLIGVALDRSEPCPVLSEGRTMKDDSAIFIGLDKRRRLLLFICRPPVRLTFPRFGIDDGAGSTKGLLSTCMKAMKVLEVLSVVET